MRLFLATLAALLAFAPAARAQPVRTVAEGTNIDWSYEHHPRPVQYRVGDVDLTISGRPDPEYPDSVTPILRVAMPGLDPVELEGSPTSPTFEHRVTVGRWDAQRPFVLFQSFSGGAHCCNMVQVVYPEHGRLDRVELGEWDGDYWDDLPTDRNGDGAVDFVQVDNAFLYAFTSYADSWAPPQVMNIVGGVPVDVSTDPGFRPLFEAAAVRQREACVHPQDEAVANGACAAYVASAARIGRFDAAWAEMLQAYDRNFEWTLPTGCKSALVDLQCPQGQEIEYGDYPAALRAFLVDLGYIEG